MKCENFVWQEKRDIFDEMQFLFYVKECVMVEKIFSENLGKNEKRIMIK